MSDIFFQYRSIEPTTWFWMSSFLVIGLFFKFSRVWSVRNLDLLLLIAMAPGLLMIHYGRTARPETATSAVLSTASPIATDLPPSERNEPNSADKTESPNSAPTKSQPTSTEPVEPPKSDSSVAPDASTAESPAPSEVPSPSQAENAAPVPAAPTIETGARLTFWGFVWLLGVSVAWLARLLLDSTMTRRPLLEPNLSPGGLLFLGISLFAVLMTNVIVSQPRREEVDDVRSAQRMLSGEKPAIESLKRHGPGYYAVFWPRLSTLPAPRQGGAEDNAPARRVDLVVTAKVIAILSQLAIVAAMVMIGWLHFDNIHMGIGAATLYLILPASAQFAGHVDQALPAALLLWAVVFYRRPLEAGLLIALAMGTTYYALYLLPLWLSFYWQRGLLRFLLGASVSLTGLTLVLWLCSSSGGDFVAKFQAMFGIWAMQISGLEGVWVDDGWSPWFRIPLLSLFILLAAAFAAWPAQKNLGTLLSCSAAVMVAAQFWHGHGGGSFVVWWLPAALMTVFRPNLEDRIALTVLGEGWFPKRRRLRVESLDQAA